MLRHFLTDEAFQSGIVRYLRKFRYKNAKNEDLWDSLTNVCYALFSTSTFLFSIILFWMCKMQVLNLTWVNTLFIDMLRGWIHIWRTLLHQQASNKECSKYQNSPFNSITSFPLLGKHCLILALHFTRILFCFGKIKIFWTNEFWCVGYLFCVSCSIAMQGSILTWRP